MGLLQRQLASQGKLAKARIQPQLFIQVIGRPRRQVSNQRAHEFVQSQGRQPPLGGNQSNRQSLNHPDGDLRTFYAHGFKGLAIEFEQLRPTDRHCTRCSCFTQHNAHFTKEVTWGEFCNYTICDQTALLATTANLDLPALDHVEIDSGIAFVEDDLAVFEDSLEGLVNLDMRRFAAAQNRSPLPPRKIKSATPREPDPNPRAGFFVLWRRFLESPRQDAVSNRKTPSATERRRQSQKTVAAAKDAVG